MKLTKHFDSKEFACPCCGKADINLDTALKIEKARVVADIPFIINSGVRCEVHNEKVKGVSSSAHVKGFAVDIKAERSRERFIIMEALIGAGFNRFGVAKTFIHVDDDPNKPRKVTWVY